MTGLFLFLSSKTVEVVRASTGPAVQAVYATGTVEASVMLPIAARSSARLVELNVDEGDQVLKDQLLARLESDDLQSILTQARAKGDLASRQFERYADSYARRVVSAEAFDRVKSEFESAKAEVSRAEAEANFLNLRAPDDGRVIRRDGEVGQMIPAHQAVFWLAVSSAPLRITSEVDEEDISRVQVEQDVLIRADAFPGQIFRGKVQTITPKGDPVARSFRVRVGFSEKTPLQIGMTAETNIIISERENALLVPSSAVVNNTLWAVSAGRLKQLAVVVGAKGPERTEIISGVSRDDLVAINPEKDFKSGRRVRAVIVEAAK